MIKVFILEGWGKKLTWIEWSIEFLNNVTINKRQFMDEGQLHPTYKVKIGQTKTNHISGEKSGFLVTAFKKQNKNLLKTRRFKNLPQDDRLYNWRYFAALWYQVTHRLISFN